MNPNIVIEKVTFFSDPRGWVIEPVQEELLSTQRNVHIVLTHPGAVRGNHYHKQSTEVFVLMGPGLVRIREGGGIRDFAVPEGEALRFTIPPGVAHAMQNPGPKPMVLMSFNTLPHDPAHPDTWPDVLIEK